MEFYIKTFCKQPMYLELLNEKGQCRLVRKQPQMAWIIINDCLWYGGVKLKISESTQFSIEFDVGPRHVMQIEKHHDEINTREINTREINTSETTRKRRTRKATQTKIQERIANRQLKQLFLVKESFCLTFCPEKKFSPKSKCKLIAQMRVKDDNDDERMFVLK